MDILLGSFAEDNLGRFSDSELDQFERLLNEADDDLYGWALERIPVSDCCSENTVLKSFVESVRRRGGGKSN